VDRAKAANAIPSRFRRDLELLGTVNFQGPSSAANELEAAMFPSETGSKRVCSSQPNARSATINDAGLQGLTRSIIKNRVGPIFDNESAFIAKVAEQCMLDLCERLGLFAKAKEGVGTSPDTRRYVNHRSAGHR
jgi:hypothetical protein